MTARVAPGNQLVRPRGLLALVLLAGTSVAAVKSLLASERYSRANLFIRRSAGVLIALAGIYLVVRQLRPGA